MLQMENRRLLFGILLSCATVAGVFWSFKGKVGERAGRDLSLQQSLVPVSSPSIECHVQDQFSYCVYYKSLCIQKGELLIVDSNKPAGPVQDIANALNPSPWHLPFSNPLKSFDGSVLDNRGALPYRSFFTKAKYVPHLPPSSTILPDWTLVASFDALNYNIYHLVNKIHAAFYARLYEIEKLRDFMYGFNPVSSLKNLMSTKSKGYARAFMFRDYFSNWQLEFMEIALGVDTKIERLSSFQSSAAPVCFEKAVIPGAMLYLSDGLLTSVLFREMASSIKKIRVAPSERNLITIFHREDKRRILNMNEVEEAAKLLGKVAGLKTQRIFWNADASFQTQAEHMARTKVFITTHGSVLNHCMFMEPGDAVVIEVNPYQFLYPLDQQIIVNRGVYYLRYEASMQETKAVGKDQGSDPFPGVSAKKCFQDMNCYVARRDADLVVDLPRFQDLLRQAISLVK